jgi:dolichol-phosphate mannosyltransferase
VSFDVGLFIAFGAVLLSAFYIFVRLAWPEAAPQGFTSTQILILFGIGLNSIFLGVLGIYVGRIYDQVRMRPPTVISQTLNFDRPIEVLDQDLTR